MRRPRSKYTCEIVPVDPLLKLSKPWFTFAAFMEQQRFAIPATLQKTAFSLHSRHTIPRILTRSFSELKGDFNQLGVRDADPASGSLTISPAGSEQARA
jgi:hypothetical protein